MSFDQGSYEQEEENIRKAFAEKDATIAELRAKLNEADAERSQAIYDAQLLSIAHGELREQLVKLRAAVPEDVRKKLDEYTEIISTFGSSKFQVSLSQDLLSLIGALVTRSMEEIIEAFKAGLLCNESYVDDPLKSDDKLAEEYAERVLKGE